MTGPSRGVRILAGVLALASRLLPADRRARWREESLALLLDAPAARRSGYLIDLLVKLPVLARQYRLAGRPAGAPGPGRALGPGVSALVGAAMVASTLMMMIGVFGWPPVDEDAAEFLVLMGPCGLAPAVAVTAFRWAARFGNTFRPLAIALGITYLAGTGPIAAGLTTRGLEFFLSGQMSAVVAAVTVAPAPGLWLLYLCVRALLRREGPVPLALLGALAGAAMVGVLSCLPLLWFRGIGAGWLISAVGMPALFILIPTYPVFTVWAGTRLMLRRDAAGSTLLR